MEAVICRLLPFMVADGAFQMAADEALLSAAESGVATLRFYGWAQATASLGYFQPSSVLEDDSPLKGLPFVRRHSGGATLVHHHEVTYCLALPADAVTASAEPWMGRMHRLIAEAFAELGLSKPLIAATGPTVKHGEVLCFQQHTPGDLLCDGFKVVGSAQRRHRQHLMQHGGILLAGSEHAPVLPGIRELAGMEISRRQASAAILRAVRRDTGWNIVDGNWTARELNLIDELVRVKYGSHDWNKKR